MSDPPPCSYQPNGIKKLGRPKKFWRTTRQVLAGRNNRSSLEMKNAFSYLDTRSIQARWSLLS
ncbi:hypothetical protein K492DRAFT_36247 [Lichtheimia hyalospora FSU 10163]|nr:hypothetical protein K492DRAFT_36247 [Lichtheimia hyalospora FSU 10163]